MKCVPASLPLFGILNHVNSVPAALPPSHVNSSDVPPEERPERRPDHWVNGLRPGAHSLAHPAVAAVIPGASKPGRIAEDVAALSAAIPAGFWQAMRDAKLVSERAPLPIDEVKA